MSKFERARSARAAVAAMVTEENVPTEIAMQAGGGSNKTPSSDIPVAEAIRQAGRALETERLTIYLPIDLVDRVERRIAEVRRRHKVSVSGYIEAALYEFMSAGDSDVAHLKKHRVKARRSAV